MTLWRVRPMSVSTTQGHVISPDDGLPLCGLDDSPEPWVISTQRPAWPCDACLLVLAGTATRHSIARDVARVEVGIDLADAQYRHDADRIALRSQWLADHPPIIVSSGGPS
jgi:hypothetical protein